MVAFHLMNQNTREAVFPATLQHRVGTLLMFAVRSIFARPDRVAEAMQELAAQGKVPQSLADDPDPLGFLIHPGGAASLTDAAYRYVRHEPASMSCCSAPAIRRICAATSNRSCGRRCHSQTATGLPSCSAISSASASTRRISAGRSFAATHKPRRRRHASR